MHALCTPLTPSQHLLLLYPSLNSSIFLANHLFFVRENESNEKSLPSIPYTRSAKSALTTPPWAAIRINCQFLPFRVLKSATTPSRSTIGRMFSIATEMPDSTLGPMILYVFAHAAVALFLFQLLSTRKFSRSLLVNMMFLALSTNLSWQGFFYRSYI